MTARDHTAAVLGELERTLGAISPDAAEKLVDRIVGRRRSSSLAPAVPGLPSGDSPCA